MTRKNPLYQGLEHPKLCDWLNVFINQYAGFAHMLVHEDFPCSVPPELPLSGYAGNVKWCVFGRAVVFTGTKPDSFKRIGDNIFHGRQTHLGEDGWNLLNEAFGDVVSALCCFADHEHPKRILFEIEPCAAVADRE